MFYDHEVNHLVAFYWDGIGDKEPFICGINGKFTIEDLEAIQIHIRANLEEYATRGPGTYTYSAIYMKGEYMDVYKVHDPYWELSFVEFESAIRPNVWALYGMKTPILANIVKTSTSGGV